MKLKTRIRFVETVVVVANKSVCTTCVRVMCVCVCLCVCDVCLVTTKKFAHFLVVCCFSNRTSKWRRKNLSVFFLCFSSCSETNIIFSVCHNHCQTPRNFQYHSFHILFSWVFSRHITSDTFNWADTTAASVSPTTELNADSSTFHGLNFLHSSFGFQAEIFHFIHQLLTFPKRKSEFVLHLTFIWFEFREMIHRQRRYRISCACSNFGWIRWIFFSFHISLDDSIMSYQPITI